MPDWIPIHNSPMQMDIWWQSYLEAVLLDKPLDFNFKRSRTHYIWNPVILLMRPLLIGLAVGM